MDLSQKAGAVVGLWGGRPRSGTATHFSRRIPLRPPKNKAENIAMLRAGRLGNTLRTWATTEEVLAAGVADCSVRSKTPGGPCVYRTPVADLKRDDGVYYNESAPDEFLTMQGEFCRIPTVVGGWSLFYSHLQLPMRKALAGENGLHAFGVEAIQLLRRFCNPVGFDMLMELVDRFDGDPGGQCSFEFSCYGRHLGWWPRNNVVIWEIRAY